MSSSTRKHRTVRPRRQGVLAIAASFVLVAAACGDDDDDGATSSATDAVTATTAAPAETSPATEAPETTSAPIETTGETTGESTPNASGDTTPPSFPDTIANGQGVTDTEIKIGMVVDQSGPYAILAPGLLAAFDANVSFINDNGGIAGRQITYDVIDTKSDPAQILQAFKKFWEEEKVFAIYEADAIGPPLDYVQQNDVLLHLLGGPPAVFSSKYPSVIPTGSITPTWNLQAGYAVVHYLERDIKTVAVTYAPFEEPMLDFIEEGWKTLGAEEVLFDPFPDPTAPCDTLVLKYKDAGVDYWDMHATSFLTCVPAQLTAGWSPPMGQGGPSTSSFDLSMLIGKPMADLGIIAGSPNALATGYPRFEEPQQRNIEYVDNMNKYAAEWSATHDLNDFVPQISYTSAQLFVDGITAIAQEGEISPEAFLNWAHTVENWDPILADPVPSMAPDCKTGNDSTIWGQWTWDEENQKLVMEPFAPEPGEHMVRTSDFLPDLDPCYLTQFADELFT